MTLTELKAYKIYGSSQGNKIYVRLRITREWKNAPLLYHAWINFILMFLRHSRIEDETKDASQRKTLFNWDKKKN